MGLPKCGQSLSEDWNIRSVYFLALMSLGYMIGEIAHFLIITTSRPVAREIQYGDKGCYYNNTFPIEQKNESIECEVFKDASSCMAVISLMGIPTSVSILLIFGIRISFTSLSIHYVFQSGNQCEWSYTGLGYEAQFLAGPSWVAVFTITSLLTGFASDSMRGGSFGRHRLMALGFFIFSMSCLLMGCAQHFWQLVLLRMGIAVGKTEYNDCYSNEIIICAFAHDNLHYDTRFQARLCAAQHRGV